MEYTGIVRIVLMIGMRAGCGKTAFVQALASESMLNVISIKGYVIRFCYAIIRILIFSIV